MCHRKASHRGDSSNRQSRLFHKLSLRRHGSSGQAGRGDGDRVKLVESEGGEGGEEEEGEDGGVPVGERDVMSDVEIENVKVSEEGNRKEGGWEGEEYILYM